jgi:hypothetical protein
MTTPSTRSGRGPGCRQGSVATASSPRPGSTMRPCHGRVAWASSLCRRSPTSAGSTRRRGKCSWTGSRSSRPSATAAATTAQGQAGGRGASRGAGPAPTRPCCPTCHRSALGAGRAEEPDHAHRPDGPDKAVPPTVGRRGGFRSVCRRLGWAVRRPVLVPARAAGSVAVAEMRVRRASWPACGRRGWAGWRDR